MFTIFDIDGVLCPFTREVYVPTANELFGLKLDKNQKPKEWNYVPAYTNEEQDKAIWTSPVMNKYIRDAKCIYKAVQVIRGAQNPMFLTSRGSHVQGHCETKTATMEWLADLGLHNVPIHFLPPEEKVAFAKNVGTISAWEDHPQTIMDYANNGILVFAPMYEYNEHIPDHKNVVKMYGWDSE